MTGSTVAGFYGRWAELYDRIATLPGVARWRRAAAEEVASPGDTVVDVGCGTGANFASLRERVGPTGRIVGVDITGPLLDLARERAAGHDNASVVCGDGTRLPIAGADAVLGTFVCGLFADPAAVVDRWCDLVGPGGRVGLLDATATGDVRGRPLNPFFKTFVAASSPTAGVGDALRAPFDRSDAALSRRVAASRRALADRTADRSHETFALGFVGLTSGTVEHE